MIEILIGISGSGKSTYANKRWIEDPSLTVVSRDKMRELLFSYSEKGVSNYYTKNIHPFEKKVSKYQKAIIREAISDGSDVIIDGTNLSRRYIEEFRFWNQEVKLTFFDCNLHIAINRNRSRARQVDKEVIKNQYDRYVNLKKDLEQNPINFDIVRIIQNNTLPSCIVVDIDGTLAKNIGRNPFDWGKVNEDEVHTSVYDIVNALEPSHAIIICTGRSEEAAEGTIKWLETINMKWNRFYIRKSKDCRPDWHVKEEMWRQIAEKYYITALIDDRAQVVDRARALGLKVFQVENNTF